MDLVYPRDHLVCIVVSHMNITIFSQCCNAKCNYLFCEIVSFSFFSLTFLVFIENNEYVTNVGLSIYDTHKFKIHK